MSLTHLIMLGSNACAVSFPDAAAEPLDVIMAKLRNAASAVAYLASMEHERTDELYLPHFAGALTAIEVLTSIDAALQLEAKRQNVSRESASASKDAQA